MSNTNLPARRRAMRELTAEEGWLWVEPCFTLNSFQMPVPD